VNEEGTMVAAAEPNAPAFEHENMNNRETLEVMRAYYKIKNPALRKRVVDLIKAMSAEDK
jgi:hypothetical protein